MRRLTLRLPDELLDRLRTAAAHDGRSLNAQLLWLLDRTLTRGPRR